jgi:hypothetical protein
MCVLGVDSYYWFGCLKIQNNMCLAGIELFTACEWLMPYGHTLKAFSPPERDNYFIYN